MKNNLILVILNISMFIVPLHVQAQQSSKNYHIVDSLVLEGEGGWDYCTIDTATERLYTSRGTRVQVVDLVKKIIIGEIPHTTGVHGIALASALQKGYISNGRDSSVTVFDITSLESLKVIRIDARNPDAILYDPITNRIFTFDGGSGNATAIDAVTDNVIGTIALGGKPEFAVTNNGRIYVNIEDKSMLVEFDAKSLQVLRSWSLAPGEEPSGLAIDKQHQCLFSVCSNKLMVISDLKKGIVIASVPIGERTDGAAFDEEMQLAFSSNGEGTLTVVQENKPAKFSVLENDITRPGARTLALDSKTHRIYMVTGKFGPTPAASTERPHPRPTIEPGSVTLYILEK
jgi:DNA-binding beta-propeller fold protein YncE